MLTLQRHSRDTPAEPAAQRKAPLAFEEIGAAVEPTLRGSQDFMLNEEQAVSQLSLNTLTKIMACIEKI
jgi:hypothetical protein